MATATDSTIQLAVSIAHAAVWAQMATVDSSGRPRSRVVHPVWTRAGDELIGWLTTRRTPVKTRHLAANPHVSLAYLASNHDLAYFDCTAEWVDDLEGKLACWNAFVRAEPPVGYDPITIWPDGPGSSDFAVLRLRPYRVQAGRATEIAAGKKPGIEHLTYTR